MVLPGGDRMGRAVTRATAALLCRMRDIFFCALADSVILCEDLLCDLCEVVAVWVLTVAAKAPRLVNSARQKIRTKEERLNIRNLECV